MTWTRHARAVPPTIGLRRSINDAALRELQVSHELALHLTTSFRQTLPQDGCGMPRCDRLVTPVRVAAFASVLGDARITTESRPQTLMANPKPKFTSGAAKEGASN